MRIFLLLVLISYCENRVSCFSVYDYFSEKMNQFRNSFSNIAGDISEKISEYKNAVSIVTGNVSEKISNSISTAYNYVIDKVASLIPSFRYYENDQSWRLIDTSYETKKDFSDFAAEEASKSEIESPELFRLRSEPTALLSTPQLASLHGRRIESHLVVTSDGYVLTLHRLRRPVSVKKKNGNNMMNFTILMHHGLLGSSADWILLGPKKSLPYILSSAGCDVWFANARGNYYSRGHISLKVDSLAFWNFTWEEMGTRDLPAVVDYIKKIKNSSEQLNFIGHSMGATAFFVMLSVYPEYNDYFRMGILMAPLVYMTNIVGPMRLQKEAASNPPQHLLNFLGKGEFAPNRKVPLWIANKYCKGPDLYCMNPLLFLSGSVPEKNAWSKSFTARVLYHVPAGGSTSTILHFAELVKTRKFHRFNVETEEFPLKRVTVPIALFSSNDDWLATKADVLRLYFSIANPIDHYVLRGAKLTHTDFVFHPEADTLVFSKVVDSLRNDLNPDIMFSTNDVIYS